MTLEPLCKRARHSADSRMSLDETRELLRAYKEKVRQLECRLAGPGFAPPPTCEHILVLRYPDGPRDNGEMTTECGRFGRVM